MLSAIIKGVSVGVVAAITGVFAVLVGILAIFLFAIFGALIGAITGWLVSIAPVLGPLVADGFRSFGVTNPDLVAIGAALGFVAGFFKSNLGGKC
ncbi:Uncharacterised protein [uncultured archaeon]|nr:Uncharacterised protein [uncultured archaeon]